ncbi:MAG: hypothetical protein ACR2QH_05550 [Geminicoccaceae bacterium]
MADLNHTSGYLIGVLARFLLKRLIKQGRLEEQPDDDQPLEIVMPVSRRQL